MRNIKIHKHQSINCQSYCPFCGYGPLSYTTGTEFYETEAAAQFAHEMEPNPTVLPEDGDINICAKCGNILVYVIDQNNISVRSMTNEELEELKANPYYEMIEKIVDAIKGREKYDN